MCTVNWAHKTKFVFFLPFHEKPLKAICIVSVDIFSNSIYTLVCIYQIRYIICLLCNIILIYFMLYSLISNINLSFLNVALPITPQISRIICLVNKVRIVSYMAYAFMFIVYSYSLWVSAGLKRPIIQSHLIIKRWLLCIYERKRFTISYLQISTYSILLFISLLLFTDILRVISQNWRKV